MTFKLETDPTWDTNTLLANVLNHCKNGERVQFLVKQRAAENVVQRLRVALSRSRARNKARGKKVESFTLRHSIHKHTDQAGRRQSCIVMWIEKETHHVMREMLDDLMERDS